MFQRFRLFLGPERFRALIALFIFTGIASTVVTFIPTDWVVAVQTFLVLVFFVGAAVLIGGRMTSEQRTRWLSILAPAFGLVILGVLYPVLRAFFWGGALGWLLVGMLIFGRARAPMQYRQAIKHLRHRRYKEAVDVMSDLIKMEPDVPNHYRFRANLFMLWGKMDRARRDFEIILKISPENLPARIEAYDGLSGLEMQLGRYDAALESALAAYDLAPDQWVTAYNVGLLYDRLDNPDGVLDYLGEKLTARVPDSRHRLLIALYLIRAHVRKGDVASAESILPRLRRERGGLMEWQRLIASEDAAILKRNFEDDVALASSLISGETTVNHLAKEPVQ